MLRPMKLLGVWLCALLGFAAAVRGDEEPPAPTGFVEFVESDIIPMMIETGETAGAAASWPAGATDAAAAGPVTNAAPAAGESGPASGLRDPFWPVGYVPPPPVSPAEEGGSSTNRESPSAVLQWEGAIKAVAVQGIMKTGPETYVAMVNGQVIGLGDIVSVRFGGRDYRWTVATVSGEGVSFKRVEEASSPP